MLYHAARSVIQYTAGSQIPPGSISYPGRSASILWYERSISGQWQWACYDSILPPEYDSGVKSALRVRHIITWPISAAQAPVQQGARNAN